MAFCTNCGAKVDDGVKFCTSCGQALAPEAAAGEAAASQQEAEEQPKPAGQQAQQIQESVQQGVQQGVEFLNQVAKNVADVTEEMDPADIEKNKTMGGLAYILFFLPMISCPDSKYAHFHANQGLLLLILVVAANVVSRMLYAVLRGGLRGFASLLSSVLFLAVAAIAVIGLINGFTGKAKELPVIGKYRLLK
ncbi:MAG: zinc ribbon domain-containing protein [Clostridiales bacterium]|nr:zinc ribbon domain-containing protein [Clostridiales bacterium]